MGRSKPDPDFEISDKHMTHLQLVLDDQINFLHTVSKDYSFVSKMDIDDKVTKVVNRIAQSEGFEATFEVKD